MHVSDTMSDLLILLLSNLQLFNSFISCPLLPRRASKSIRDSFTPAQFSSTGAGRTDVVVIDISLPKIRNQLVVMLYGVYHFLIQLFH